MIINWDADQRTAFFVFRGSITRQDWLQVTAASASCSSDTELCLGFGKSVGPPYGKEVALSQLQGSVLQSPESVLFVLKLIWCGPRTFNWPPDSPVSSISSCCMSQPGNYLSHCTKPYILSFLDLQDAKLKLTDGNYLLSPQVRAIFPGIETHYGFSGATP